MNAKKYLSDALTIEDIKEIKTPGLCIYAGVGSGKNYFVENVLQKDGNVLYITSRRAKANEIILGDFGNKIIDWQTVKNQYCDNGSIVLTFAGVEKIVNSFYIQENLDNICEFFKYIVIDEAHALMTDAMFADSTFYAVKFIEYVITKNNKVILMTGTPAPLKEYINHDKKNWTIIDKRDECINIMPQKVCLIDRKKIVDKLVSEERTVYMTSSATGIWGKYRNWK